MQISANLPKMEAALASREPVACDKGSYYIEGRVYRLVRWVFGTENRRLATCAAALVPLFDERERTMKPTADVQGIASLVLSRLGDCRERQVLCGRYVAAALKHPEIPQGKFESFDIIEDAKRWKGSQLNNSDTRLQALTPIETERLQRVSTISVAFFNFLKNNPLMRVEFYRWALHYDLKMKIYMLFPAVVQRLKRCYLPGRIALFGGKGLKLIEGVPKLLVDGKFYSLLDESIYVEIKSRRGDPVLVPLKEILDSFANKNAGTGNWEFGKDGIIPWNNSEIGWYDPLTKKTTPIKLEGDWWDQIPIYPELNCAQTCEWMHLTPEQLQPGKWVVAACASREITDRNKLKDPAKSHGYLDIAIPLPDGRWKILSFGLLAKHYPEGLLGMLAFVGNTVEGTIQGSDEANTNFARQHVRVPFVCDEAKGREAMELIAGFIAKSRLGKLNFALMAKNCGSVPDEVVTKTFRSTSLYVTQAIDTTPTLDPLRTIQWIISICPKFMHPYMFRAVALLFFGGRSRLGESVYNSAYYASQDTYLPAKPFSTHPQNIQYGKFYSRHRKLRPRL